MATHPAAGAATAAGTADDAVDAHCRTFAIAGEDHTLGNALSVALNKLPAVTFAGYTVPHPAEPVVHVRVQTSPESGVTAPQALKQAAADVTAQCDVIETTFQDALLAFNKRTEQSAGAEAMQS